MSSFARQGQRLDKQATQKKTEQHVKEFYKIIGHMDVLAKQLDPSIEYTEENINDYVKPIYRTLDPMEMFLLLGKLNNGKEDNAN
jgi:hypothetical protein